MISSLTGTVDHVGLHQAVLNVSGVGMLVHATPHTLAGLRLGETGMLHTSLVVREDSLTLYGFGSPDEREVFEVLLGVSGICLLYTSPSPRDRTRSRMPSSA